MTKMKIIVASVVILVSLPCTLATTLIQRPVQSREEMANHWTGYPFPFVRQDIRRYNPETFPQYFRLDSPLKSPGIALEVEPFVASWLVILLCVATIGWGVARLFRLVRRNAWR